MQKRYRLRLNQDISILNIMLVKGEKITYKKRLQGWGINESYFDIKEIREERAISRRIFGVRKQTLLDSNFIRHVKSRDDRENCYGITPLGIAFLSGHVNLQYASIKKIQEIIGYHYKKFFEKMFKDKDLSKIDFYLMKNIFGKSSQQLKRNEVIVLQKVLQNIKIFEEKEKITIYLTNSIPQNMPIISSIYTISKEGIYNDFQGSTSVRLKRSSGWFDGAMSHFISLSFNQQLILQNFLIIGGNMVLPPKRKKVVEELKKIYFQKEFTGLTNSLIDDLETKIEAFRSIKQFI